MKKFIDAIAFCTTVAFGAFAQAGHVRGPQIGNARCEAYGSVTCHETFRVGEMAEFAIHGDGYTDLDLFVNDMNGRLVGSGSGHDGSGIGPLIRSADGNVPHRRPQSRQRWNRYGIGTN